jgi:hypothetical protein
MAASREARCVHAGNEGNGEAALLLLVVVLLLLLLLLRGASAASGGRRFSRDGASRRHSARIAAAEMAKEEEEEEEEEVCDGDGSFPSGAGGKDDKLRNSSTSAKELLERVMSDAAIVESTPISDTRYKIFARRWETSPPPPALS